MLRFIVENAQILCCGSRSGAFLTKDLGSGKEKSGSEINIPDLQHWYSAILRHSVSAPKHFIKVKARNFETCSFNLVITGFNLTYLSK
jgi:hypothetical protein